MKNIKFGSKAPHLQKIIPAKAAVPEWYKQTQIHPDGDKSFSIVRGNITFKGCSPFMDTFITGYVATLWQSVEVLTNEDGTKDLVWPLNDYPVASVREAGGNSSLPIPAGHTGQHFTWSAPFSFETPKGYSALITHPLNRFDLPFTTLSGIIDADKITGPGNLPFFIREDFEGIIPAGTPIFQIIPFKREDWTHTQSEEVAKLGQQAGDQAMAFAPGFYKKNKWARKTFN